MITKLKPCPFCGSEALTRSVDQGCLPSFMDIEKQDEIMSRTPYVSTCSLSCDECGATVQGYATTDKLKIAVLDTDLFDKAVEDCYRKWNRRVSE